jgi:amino acid transporter
MPGLVVRLGSLVFGRRLANRENQQRKIGAFEGVPAMGLDGLGSSAYGPEAALTILMPLGAASLAWIGWVMAPIVLLLLVLFASYWQTIRAYPNNGGAYIVSKENLGTNFSLLAAAALMVDYVLNVAVGISAGVGALVSAVPNLQSYILPLCLGILAGITIVNLRGTLDAGRVFALPTYVFVASFAVIVGTGVYAALVSGGHPQPVVAPPPLSRGTEAVSLWLLLRAFAAGCTAMTGVEAVSNGMTAFREPPVTHGRRTLTAIVAILGLLLVSIAYLATCYGIGAMDQTKPGYRSVLSQLASATVGNGVLYYLAIGSLLCVLAFSANTSFVDFPRLCHMVAADGFLPKAFAIAGRRLVYSVGILYLAVVAGLLLFVFGGITDALIPLFAIGAFLTFTLSQAGMVMHWRRAIHTSRPEISRGHADRAHLWINGVGAATTGVALGIIVVAKFKEGAWITVLVIPIVVMLLRTIHAYYVDLERRTRETAPLQLHDTRPPIVLIVMESWNKLAYKALDMALAFSPDVIAVHLLHLAGPDQEEHRRDLEEQWKVCVEDPVRTAGLTPPRLMLLPAPHRAIHEPILKLARKLESESGGRRVAVLIPEMIKLRWYQYLLHVDRARRLRSKLLKCGDPQLMVVDVPWYWDNRWRAPPRNAS